MSAAVILIGAPGSGKSSVLGALSGALERERVEHGSFESEQLSQGWPLLPAQVWLGQLAAVLDLQRRAGRELMLLCATVASAGELAALREATGAATVLVACLAASPDTVAARLQAREPDTWQGKKRLIGHARRLATVVPALSGIDVVYSTERTDADAVAGELLSELVRRGIVRP